MKEEQKVLVKKTHVETPVEAAAENIKEAEVQDKKSISGVFNKSGGN